jgi:hypothetical protein
MSASSDEIPLSLSLPRPLQASPVCEALQYFKTAKQTNTMPRQQKENPEN